MNIKKSMSALVSLLSLGLSSQSQGAAPVPDQFSPPENPIPFTYAVGGPSAQVLYQSLTVGLGGRLAELRLPIGCESGQVILEIFDADSNGLPIPESSARLTRRYRADFFPVEVFIDFQTLPLGGRVSVNPGDRIVIVLSNPTGSCGIAAGQNGDGYLAGTGHGDDTTNPFPPVPLNISPGGGDDLPFQTLVRLTGP